MTFSIFYIDGKTVIGNQVEQDINVFPADQFDNHVFIQDPAVVDFSISQKSGDTQAQLNWTIMPYIPKFVKSQSGDITFAFPKSRVAFCAYSNTSLVSKLQQAYNELIK